MSNEEKVPEELHPPAGDPAGEAAQPIAWVRLFAEATAIVLSILVAFAIDAGWENLREREEEQHILAALETEMGQNLAELDTILESLQMSHTSVATLVGSTPGSFIEATLR